MIKEPLIVLLNPVVRLGVSIRLGPIPPFWGLDSE